MKQFFFLGVCVLFFPLVSHAQVVITEIMYDLAEGSDSGREWIEVFNAGSTAVSLTDLRVFENSRNHTISGSGTVPPGTYAVIADNPAKFKTDWPSFTGEIFDSAFSLNNGGEKIEVRNAAGATIDSAIYTDAGAKGTGDSWQRTASGAFDFGVPTPGLPTPAVLSKTPPKQKSSKKTVAAVSAVTASDVEGSLPSGPAQEIVTLEPTADPSILPWLLPFFLASVGSAGLVWSRRLKKDEWDIVEEVEETS